MRSWSDVIPTVGGMRCFALVMTICLFFAGLFPVAARADLGAFQNGAFSDGFTGWNGQLFPISGIVDPASDPHFSLVGGQGAQIANDDFDYMVFLFQNFQMASLSPGYDRMSLSFDLQWLPTGSGSISSFSAVLYEYDPDTMQLGAPMDLLAGIPAEVFLSKVQIVNDVTAYAGRSVELCFSISDEDYLTPDYLRAGNISFAQHTSTPVPLDSSVIMLVSGLAGLGVMRRRRDWRTGGNNRNI